ncbi:MAG: hypothetical protein AB7P33_18970 [Dehalococcoidia bacterium]
MSYFEDTLAEYLALLELGGDAEAFLARHPRIRTRLREHARLAAEIGREAAPSVNDDAKDRAFGALLSELERLRQKRTERARRPRPPRRRLWVVAGMLGFGLAFSVSFASGADPTRPIELIVGIPAVSLPDISLVPPVDIPSAVFNEPLEPSPGCQDCLDFAERASEEDHQPASRVTLVPPLAAPSPAGRTPSPQNATPTVTRPLAVKTPVATPPGTATPLPSPTVVPTRRPISTPTARTTPVGVVTRPPQATPTPTSENKVQTPVPTSSATDPIVIDPCSSSKATPTATPDEAALKPPRRCTPGPTVTGTPSTPEPSATPRGPLTPQTPGPDKPDPDDGSEDEELVPPEEKEPPPAGDEPVPAATPKPPPDE